MNTQGQARVGRDFLIILYYVSQYFMPEALNGPSSQFPSSSALSPIDGESSIFNGLSCLSIRYTPGLYPPSLWIELTSIDAVPLTILIGLALSLSIYSQLY